MARAEEIRRLEEASRMRREIDLRNYNKWVREHTGPADTEREVFEARLDGDLTNDYLVPEGISR